MNILVLNWRDIRHPQAGGAEVHFKEIFKRLVEKNHKVILLTTRFKHSAKKEEQDGINVLRWGSTYFFNWEAPFLIRKILKKQHIDCIIDDVNKIPFFTPKWFPKIKCGVIFHHFFGKTIFGLTAYPLAQYVLLLENLSFWGYKNSPCCTVSKSTAMELVQRGFSENSISIIENSVDTEKYSPDNTVKKEQNLILYTGRLKKYKNIEILLDAIKCLNEQGKKTRLIIAGCGDHEKYLQAYANKLNIREQVEFLGFVDEREKIKLYKKACVFVNPSQKEGWGITNIEASACGTAVIANNVEGLRDSVKNMETGLLYKENDCKDLVRCINLILDNTDLRMKFEREGRKWALNFSWDKSAEKMETWIKEKVCKK